jgi:hypothetical protein
MTRLRDVFPPVRRDGEAALVKGTLARGGGPSGWQRYGSCTMRGTRSTAGLIAQARIEEPVKAARSAAERGER